MDFTKGPGYGDSRIANLCPQETRYMFASFAILKERILLDGNRDKGRVGQVATSWHTRVEMKH
jgi:hypothetical protein